MQINMIGLWLLAAKFLRTPVFTQWDAVPFLRGVEYAGVCGWLGGKPGYIGRIGLNPKFANSSALAFIWLHELGHIATGSVSGEWLERGPGGDASVQQWDEYSEEAANEYAKNHTEKLQKLIMEDGYEDFPEFVGATPGEWWERRKLLRRVERTVSGAVAASLAGRHSQPQRPGTVGGYRISAL